MRPGNLRTIGAICLGLGVLSCAASPDGTLVVGIGADRYLTELPSRPDLGKYPHNAGVFDTLARMNEQFDIEPSLAERWAFSPGTNTYRFDLRRGVQFHDGAELTATDVKYTFDLIIKSYPDNYEALGPDSVQVRGRHTVEITPTSTNNRLVEQLAHPIWGVNRANSDPLRPVGTGPFRFVDYARHDHFAVERFAGYWNAGNAARTERIVFHFVPDPQARTLALRAGQLDLIADVPPMLAEELERADMRVMRSPVGACDALSVNIHGRPPYTLGGDPAIRAAVGLALDRRSIVAAAWRRSAEPSRTWIPPLVLGSHEAEVTGPAFDAARAKQLLEAAGWRTGADGIRWKGGQRLSLLLLVAFPTTDHQRSPELIQDQLKRVGMDLRIEMMPDAAVSGARRRSGQFDLLQATTNQNEAYPCFLPDLIYYSKSGSPSNRWVAPGGAVDAAIEACRSAAHTDEARAHAAAAIHALVDVEHVVVPLAGLRRVWAARDGVSAFVPHPSDTNQRWNTVQLQR